MPAKLIAFSLVSLVFACAVALVLPPPELALQHPAPGIMPSPAAEGLPPAQMGAAQGLSLLRIALQLLPGPLARPVGESSVVDGVERPGGEEDTGRGDLLPLAEGWRTDQALYLTPTCGPGWPVQANELSHRGEIYLMLGLMGMEAPDV